MADGGAGVRRGGGAHGAEVAVGDIVEAAERGRTSGRLYVLTPFPTQVCPAELEGQNDWLHSGPKGCLLPCAAPG